MKQLTLVSTVFILLFAQVVSSQIPQTISYQGLLTDANNDAVADGNYKLTFKLFEADQGGAAIWQEAYDDLVVTGGIFNVILGGENPLNLQFDQPYWLDITVGEESPLTPRIELTSSAYSLNTRTIADSAVTSAKIAAGNVVRNINALTDSVRLVAGDNIAITTDADSIIISASGNQGGAGDITAIQAGAGLTGGGESGEVSLAIAEKGVTSSHLADDAVTSAKIQNGSILNEDVAADFTASYADTAAYALTAPQSGDGHSLNAADGDPVDAIYIDNAGNVGVGKTNPTAALDVAGNIKSSGKVIASAYSSTSPFIFEAPEGTERARIDDVSGNFGVGTNSPQFNFHLDRSAGTPPPPTRLGIQWSVISLPPSPALTDWCYYAIGGASRGQGGTQLIRKSGTTLRFSTQDEILSGEITEQMRLTGSGDLGIGIMNPTANLHVEGDNGVLFTGTAGSGSIPTEGAGTRMMWYPAKGAFRAGFVDGNQWDNDNIGVWSVATGWGTQATGQHSFAGGVQAHAIHSGTFVWNDHAVSGGDIFASTAENQFLIRARGGVGIGTNTPLAELDVVGRTRTTVLEITGGSDLAEPFDITGSEAIKPGMVVAIDPENAGQLRIADKAYDRTVAGCLSGANGINPGLTMRQEGTVADGSLPVALSGRVYCRADAAYGSIQPGDLLTTSDTPGHAMKVIDHARAQGAILGKAMTTLAQGRGLVLVLVTLQ